MSTPTEPATAPTSALSPAEQLLDALNRADRGQPTPDDSRLIAAGLRRALSTAATVRALAVQASVTFAGDPAIACDDSTGCHMPAPTGGRPGHAACLGVRVLATLDADQTTVPEQHTHCTVTLHGIDETAFRAIEKALGFAYGWMTWRGNRGGVTYNSDEHDTAAVIRYARTRGIDHDITTVTRHTAKTAVTV